MARAPAKSSGNPKAKGKTRDQLEAELAAALADPNVEKAFITSSGRVRVMMRKKPEEVAPAVPPEQPRTNPATPGSGGAVAGGVPEVKVKAGASPSSSGVSVKGLLIAGGVLVTGIAAAVFFTRKQ